MGRKYAKMVSGIWVGGNATEGPACFRINVPGRSILGDLLLKRHSLPSFNISSERYGPYCCKENYSETPFCQKSVSIFAIFVDGSLLPVFRLRRHFCDNFPCSHTLKQDII
jgi:hypothetical protein